MGNAGLVAQDEELVKGEPSRWRDGLHICGDRVDAVRYVIDAHRRPCLLTKFSAHSLQRTQRLSLKTSWPNYISGD